MNQANAGELTGRSYLLARYRLLAMAGRLG